MRYAKNASQYDFPEYVGKPRWYCLASSPRTGSSLCAEYFEYTGLAGRPLEYFHPKYQEDFSSRWAFGDKKNYICLLERWRTSPNGVFGVKCHFDQFMDFQTFVPDIWSSIARISCVRRFPILKAWFPSNGPLSTKLPASCGRRTMMGKPCCSLCNIVSNCIRPGTSF
ncbi:MAG: hypothetical protein IKN64_02485 [Desulfovibrio sp.]|nr:hypothetical protein [Desulfovibrio sp.]